MLQTPKNYFQKARNPYFLIKLATKFLLTIIYNYALKSDALHDECKKKKKILIEHCQFASVILIITSVANLRITNHSMIGIGNLMIALH